MTSAVNGRHEQYAAVPLDDDAVPQRDAQPSTIRRESKEDQQEDADGLFPVVMGDGARDHDDENDGSGRAPPLLAGPAVAAEARR
jgi:hypothetical protein